MESLKATKAREITKENVTEAETLVVNGVSVSKPTEHPMQAGDFYFRPTLIQSYKPLPWYRRVFIRNGSYVAYEQVTCIVLIHRNMKGIKKEN